MRFVQVCLDVDASALLCVCDAALQRPLTSIDGALHPIGHSGSTGLMTALSALMLTVHTHTHTHTHELVLIFMLCFGYFDPEKIFFLLKTLMFKH